VAAAAREYFTVDLRGLRAALAARAAEAGMTESDVLRGVLAAALHAEPDRAITPTLVAGDGSAQTSKVNLSVRLNRAAAQRLDSNARATGLSRGAYLTRLIDGAPPVTASADRKVAAAALSRSSAELAILSRDLHHLTLLLRQGAVEAARPYRERLENADADIRAHLAQAAAVLAQLAPVRIAARRVTVAAPQRSPP
jgi:hypothetical protein